MPPMTMAMIAPSPMPPAAGGDGDAPEEVSAEDVSSVRSTKTCPRQMEVSWRQDEYKPPE